MAAGIVTTVWRCPLASIATGKRWPLVASLYKGIYKSPSVQDRLLTRRWPLVHVTTVQRWPVISIATV